jgi:hypothetical protein
MDGWRGIRTSLLFRGEPGNAGSGTPRNLNCASLHYTRSRGLTRICGSGYISASRCPREAIEGAYYILVNSRVSNVVVWLRNRFAGPAMDRARSCVLIACASSHAGPLGQWPEAPPPRGVMIDMGVDRDRAAVVADRQRHRHRVRSPGRTGLLGHCAKGVTLRSRPARCQFAN